jgi:hypothetical protein
LFQGVWMRLYTLLCVASPVWLYFGYRWVTHGGPSRTGCRVFVTALGCVVCLQVVYGLDREDIAYVPLLCVVFYWVLLYVAEGHRIGRINRTSAVSGSAGRSAEYQNHEPIFDAITIVFRRFIDTTRPDIERSFDERACVSLKRHFDIASRKMAYMTLTLVLTKHRRAFLVGEERTQFRLMAGGKLAHLIEQELRSQIALGGIPANECRDKALGLTAKEMAQCDTAVQLAMENFSTLDPCPIDPILLLIHSEVPLTGNMQSSPHERDETYSSVFKEMVKISEKMIEERKA